MDKIIQTIELINDKFKQEENKSKDRKRDIATGLDLQK